MKKYQTEYYRKYPWKNILVSIKQRCNNPNDISYKYYGLKGRKCRITSEELEFLWFRDKAYDMDMPSIDRKKSNKDYTLDNCQFIEFKNNVIKGNRESHIKPILQSDLNGKFIKKFNSIIEASLICNIDQSNISKCCRKIPNYKTCGGYKWKYKESNK